MSKNDNYINDAKALVDCLERFDELNVSSKALLRQAKAFIDENEGRLAFDFATRAKVMEDYNR